MCEVQDLNVGDRIIFVKGKLSIPGSSVGTVLEKRNGKLLVNWDYVGELELDLAQNEVIELKNMENEKFIKENKSLVDFVQKKFNLGVFIEISKATGFV